MKLARARGKITLPGNRFDTSRKIPEEVYATGELRIVADLLDGDLANVHMGTVALGIRHVLCAPLRLVRYLDRADLPSETQDDRRALSRQPREGLAAVGNARVGARHAGDRSRRRDRECAALPADARAGADRARAARSRPRSSARCCRPAATSARSTRPMGTSLPSRSIGGDFFDFTDRPDGSFGFAVGDVSGKGPAAALLTAKIQGLLGAGADHGTPAEIMPDGQSRSDPPCRRSEVRDRLPRDAEPDGLLTFCNAGHNPPLIYGRGGLRRLDVGQHAGRDVRLRRSTRTRPNSCRAGDVLIVYSDGVTEALDVDGQEFGEDRLAAIAEERHSEDASAILDAIIDGVQTFARGAAQHDDVTAMVVKFTG